jgi:hypothetical protein
MVAQIRCALHEQRCRGQKTRERTKPICAGADLVVSSGAPARLYSSRRQGGCASAVFVIFMRYSGMQSPWGGSCPQRLLPVQG